MSPSPTPQQALGAVSADEPLDGVSEEHSLVPGLVVEEI